MYVQVVSDTMYSLYLSNGGLDAVVKILFLPFSISTLVRCYGIGTKLIMKLTPLNSLITCNVSAEKDGCGFYYCMQRYE